MKAGGGVDEGRESFHNAFNVYTKGNVNNRSICITSIFISISLNFYSELTCMISLSPFILKSYMIASPLALLALSPPLWCVPPLLL